MDWWQQEGTVILPDVNIGHLQVNGALWAHRACRGPAETLRPVASLRLNGLCSQELKTD